MYQLHTFLFAKIYRLSVFYMHQVNNLRSFICYNTYNK
nr:MAG TPA: hypothetical protein [Caudoviricetes sp.]